MLPGLAAEQREAGVHSEFRQSGFLKVALTEEDVKTLERDLAWQGELEMAVAWLTAEEVRQRETEIVPDVLCGVLSPPEGHVLGQRLVDALVHAASQQGATFLEGTEVVGLETDGRRVIGARTTNETFYADHTVLAAGPWSGIAGRWVPSPIPVRPVKGQRIPLRKTGFLPQSPVHNFRGCVVPRLDGSVLVGATRHEGEFDQEITADAIARMIATAVSSFPLLKDARLVEARAGVRPGSPDGVPIMGPVPGLGRAEHGIRQDMTQWE